MMHESRSSELKRLKLDLVRAIMQGKRVLIQLNDAIDLARVVVKQANIFRRRKYQKLLDGLTGRRTATRESMFKLIRLYDGDPNGSTLHDRAQIMSISHIALANFFKREGYESTSLLGDVFMHGEYAGEKGGFIGERNTRATPLFESILMPMVKMTKGGFDIEDFMASSKAKEKADKRKHLTVVH